MHTANNSNTQTHSCFLGLLMTVHIAGSRGVLVWVGRGKEGGIERGIECVGLVDKVWEISKKES